MKRTLITMVLCVISATAMAQGLTTADEAQPIRSAHYLVYGDDEIGQLVSGRMEERFSIYNKLFRFNPNKITSSASPPLVVRVFGNTEAYNNYLGSLLETPLPGAVYLHYNQVNRRELLIDWGSADAEKNLPYQAFIQFIRAFVSNPPAWIREGFAVYFSRLNFTSGALSFEEQLDWLETVKAMNLPLDIVGILTADSRGLPEHFPALAWSLVSFLMNSGGIEYSRSLTDCILLMSDTASAEENGQVLMDRIVSWNDIKTLAHDHQQYINSRKTFRWLIEEGQQAYTEEDYITAELSFLSARSQRPSHFASWYYLGLIEYEKGNFVAAEQYYLHGLRLGADPALTAYALGLNAAKSGIKADAEKYLLEAARIAPERYKERAESVLSRLN